MRLWEAFDVVPHKLRPTQLAYSPPYRIDESKVHGNSPKQLSRRYQQAIHDPLSGKVAIPDVLLSDTPQD